MLEIQRLACAIVQAALTGRNLNNLLADTWRRNSKITSSERAAIQDISFGTLRFYGLLNAILHQLLVKPLSDEEVRALLLIGLYQLHYTRAKSFAIVDHAVSTVEYLRKPAAKGLVNAVLRNFLRKREMLLDNAVKEEIAAYNYPKWWIAKVKEQYPINWQSILNVSQSPPPLTLRINRRHCSVESYLARLAEQGIDAEVIGKDALVLANAMPVDKIPGFTEGIVSVQDASAQYAASLLDIASGMNILDACCAPGGKTTHLLESADIDLLALDSDAERIKRVNENLTRLQLTARLKAADAAEVNVWWDGKQFDRILLDVPCSGSGVTRRHPDIKWARRPGDIAQFCAQQTRLLDALWPTLKLGGKLLYATCSVFREENHNQIDAFLLRHSNARSLPIIEAPTIDGQIIPDEFHDGFFYALLVKI